ncbi:MAG: efflux transporter outer membrane subunit, partial [Proteobacteria bacterium]|nr:efflux transporter outer membrane subunit [Pseudomonadota bacterium]
MFTTALAGCSLAPDFKMPEMKLPESYKEAAPSAGQAKLPVQERGRWKKAEDLEAANKGEWWKVYGNEELNQLMKEAQEANATLKAAAARVEQSRATAEANTFSFLPNVSISGNAVRSKPSDASLAAFGNRNATLKPYNLYSARGVLSYEADLFGRVRDSYRAFLLDAAASEADFANVQLTLQADIASNYFSIRALDSEIALLRDTLSIREKAHDIMKHKYDAGAAGEQDLTRTISELASTNAELTSLERERKILDHALAVLLGKMPSEFALKPAPLVGVPPEVPAGLPSTLLERRPDIARATSLMQAANTRIGVARAAFFPLISLTAFGGYEATEMGDLFKWSSRAWALGQAGGAAITMPIFDSGRNLSRLDNAWAAYEESVNNYRQQVLVAFRDVEDSLASQNLLASQSRQQDDAAAAASRTTEVVQTRYDEGAVEFFEVVNAQRDSLAAARTA